MIFFSSTPRLIIYFVLERCSHTPLFFGTKLPHPFFYIPSVLFNPIVSFIGGNGFVCEIGDVALQAIVHGFLS